jgi:predicted O-methyltransferase YrrM
MTREETQQLIDKYFTADAYVRPQGFEHRVDPQSEALIYSFVRDFKPKSVFELGTSHGGSTCAILSALLKNDKPFKYVASELLDDLRAECALHCKENCGVEPIMIGDIMQNLDKVPKKIDFLMHDTDHDEKTTQWVFDNIFPRLVDGALVIFHDWAVSEKDGQWYGKGADGAGGWPETELILKMHRENKLPLKKVYWNFEEGGGFETGVFLYENSNH